MLGQIKTLRKESGACLAEELVNIDKELGIIVCRSPKGETKFYPSVEMEFHPQANQVEYVLSPARISKTYLKKLKKSHLLFQVI